MENGQRKLFQPSDFDKDSAPPKKSHLSKIIYATGFIIIILVAIFFVRTLPDNADNSSSLSQNEDYKLTENNINTKTIDNTSESQAASNDKQIAEEPKAKATEEPMTEATEGKKNNSEHTLSSSESYINLPTGSIEEQAHKVIRGDYGNGLERKQKLGDKYTVIQNKVNEMYRNGLVD